MTLIGTIVFITSFIGALSFGCWDNDIEIPGLYPFGAFLADWWFHDRLKPGKPHLEHHDSDGPPLVAVPGSVASINFPYPSSYFSPKPPTQYSYSSSAKRASTYTPVNGVFGVTNQKESDPTIHREYYPNAVQPNDYIAKRFIGDQAFFSDLVDVGDPLTLYNKNVFKDGTPFAAARIGGGTPDDPRWMTAAKYNLMPPLTSTGAGEASMPYYPDVLSSVNDYSGGEYATSDQSFANSAESKYCVPYRPPWYGQTQYGKSIEGQKDISSWAGEKASQTVSILGNSAMNRIVTPQFYDPQYDGNKSVQTSSQIDFVQWGWGTNNSGVVDNTTGASISPNIISTDYIETQLVQENPISNLNKTSKPSSDQPIESHVSQKKKYKPK